MCPNDLGGIPSITTPPAPPVIWILYSKPGCHLCEGLLEKLLGIPNVAATLTVRDITTQPDWWQRFAYEIPVLAFQVHGDPERILPRLSPRDSQARIAQILAAHLGSHLAKMKPI